MAWAATLATKVFELLDADKDASVSIKELIKVMKEEGESLQASVLLFDALDKDSDGKISLEELREGLVEAGTGNASVNRLLALASAAEPEKPVEEAVAVEAPAARAPGGGRAGGGPRVHGEAGDARASSDGQGVEESGGRAGAARAADKSGGLTRGGGGRDGGGGGGRARGDGGGRGRDCGGGGADIEEAGEHWSFGGGGEGEGGREWRGGSDGGAVRCVIRDCGGAYKFGVHIFLEWTDLWLKDGELRARRTRRMFSKRASSSSSRSSSRLDTNRVAALFATASSRHVAALAVRRLHARVFHVAGAPHCGSTYHAAALDRDPDRADSSAGRRARSFDLALIMSPTVGSTLGHSSAVVLP